MTTPCAIPPLDQSTTSLGWYPGQYARSPCPALDVCGWSDNALQFLANPGTPVIVPFPVTVVSTSPLVLRPNFPLSAFWRGLPSDIRVDGITPAVSVGPADKGALLGRIAPGSRGTKWSLWDGRAQAQFVLQLFREVGLEPVGGTRPTQAGFALVPVFGGRLLARQGGPADCPSGPLHGVLGAYGLGSAPTGYVETPSSVYSRYGTSAQSDTSTPTPSHENVPLEVAAASGGGLALAAAAVGLFYWWTKG